MNKQIEKIDGIVNKIKGTSKSIIEGYEKFK